MPKIRFKFIGYVTEVDILSVIDESGELLNVDDWSTEQLEMYLNRSMVRLYKKDIDKVLKSCPEVRISEFGF